MKARISGLATWLPEHVRTNDAWPAGFSTREPRGVGGSDRVFNDIPEPEDAASAALVARDLAREAGDPFLGAVRRHVADDAMTAAQAETRAALAALQDAGVTGAEVDLVLSNAIVPDHVAPPSAVNVAYAVGAHRAHALGVETACASAVSQLEIARAYIESGLARVVLLTQSHLLLRTVPLEHPASPGLGDGASAMVVGTRGTLALRGTFAVTHGQYARAVAWVRGQQPEDDTPWWQAGAGFRVGSHVPAEAKQLMRDTVSFGAATIREACRRAAIDVERLSVLASVQPRGFLPGAMAERLGRPRSVAVTTYEDIAHVGLCGPVFNLARARKLGMLQPGAVVALYGQGAGFTRAAAVLEVG